MLLPLSLPIKESVFYAMLKNKNVKIVDALQKHIALYFWAKVFASFMRFLIYMRSQLQSTAILKVAICGELSPNDIQRKFWSSVGKVLPFPNLNSCHPIFSKIVQIIQSNLTEPVYNSILQSNSIIRRPSRHLSFVLDCIVSCGYGMLD